MATADVAHTAAGLELVGTLALPDRAEGPLPKCTSAAGFVTASRTPGLAYDPPAAEHTRHSVLAFLRRTLRP